MQHRGRRGALVRAAVVLPIAALMAFHAVRAAAVETDPGGIGAKRWTDHPEALVWRTMSEVGTYAARGQPLPAKTLERVEEIAAKSPFHPEPFLIKGALAQMAGDELRAERLFAEARRRDPRSRAARYFLADRYLRSGRAVEALSEMAILAHLVPAASEQFAPALANYALTPGSERSLRAFFRSSPDFEPGVLYELARDPGNAPRILALWSGSMAPASPDWKGALVSGLVEQRQFAKARQVWSRVTGVGHTSNELFNPEFRDLPAPAPFNWTFHAKGGVAEPRQGGLQVIYFGQRDAVLADQLLTLRPGSYGFGMEVTGGVPEQSAVGWTITCVPGQRRIAELPVGPDNQRRRLETRFTVPASGCAAQRLELAGTAGEFARSVELTIGKLTLSPAG